MKGLPTSKVKGVFIGLVELKGKVVSADPLCSWLTGNECVWYTYKVEEQWRRVVTRTTTDSKGRTTTSTHVETGWQELDCGGEEQGFYLEDDTGVILVWPAGSDVEASTAMDYVCRADDPLYYGKGPSGSIINSTGRRRFVEKVVSTGAELYLVGQARERNDVVAPEIAEDEQAACYLISTRSEEQIVSSKGWESWLWVVFGLILAAGLPMWGVSQGILTEDWVIFYGAGYLLLWGLTWCWSVFNALIDLKNRVRQAGSLVEVQLQRRFDLIPRLCQVASAYRGYEKSLMEIVADLRSQGTGNPANSAGDRASGVASRLIALSEAYPDLHADTVFCQLTQELVQTENRIALAQEYYNTITTHYNTALSVFPESALAGLFHLRPEGLLSANDFARAAVKVELTGESQPSEKVSVSEDAAL